MNDDMSQSQTPEPQQPWNKPPEPRILEIKPAGQISRPVYIALTLLVVLITAPIIFFGSMLTLMSPMAGDSGDMASAAFAMYIMPILGIVLPLVIATKLLKKIRNSYKPKQEVYESKAEEVAVKTSKSILIIFLAILSPFIIWFLISLFL